MYPLICDNSECGAHDYDPQNQNLQCKVCNVGYMRDDVVASEQNISDREAIAREVWDKDMQNAPTQDS